MANLLISLIVLGIINDPFCDALNDINNAICITTTTTVENLYCGELSIEDAYTITNEIMDNNWHQILWDKKYRRIDIDTLKYFLEDNWIKRPDDGDWFDCDDYARILWGKVIMEFPGIAFGIAIIKIGDKGRHATNFMIDCNYDLWRIEPQGNVVTPWDDSADIIILRE